MRAGRPRIDLWPLFTKPLLVIDADGVTLAAYNGALVFRSREIKLTAVGHGSLASS
jgi:hypothetical protein